MRASALPLPEFGISLATYEAGSPAGPAVLFLHGNSLAADVFQHQMAAPELQHFRLLAFDLAGHGQSARAPGHYALAGHGRLLRAAIEAAGLENALVVAHSLAGLLLYELLPRLPHLRGLLTVGAPPVSAAAQVPAAFHFNELVGLYYTAEVTASQAEAMAAFALHAPAPAEAVRLVAADIRRTHGLARTELGASLAAGNFGDELSHAARTAVPLALAAGAHDQALHLGYFKTLALPSRWGAPVHLLPKAGHLPFLENPGAFNQLLLDFAAALPA